MTEHLSIQKFDEILAALIAVETLEEVKAYSNLAEAARHHAVIAQRGREAENRAAEIRIRALRKEGEILKAMKETGELRGQGGDQKSKCGGRILIDGSVTTLSALDITPHESADSQAIASIPETEFEAEVAAVKAGGGKLSTSHFARKGRGESGNDKPKRKKGPMKINAPEKDIMETRSSDGVIFAMQAARETIAEHGASWSAATRERVLSSFHELVEEVQEVFNGRKA